MEQSVIALGFFDGVHLGHGSLLRRARELGDSLGCKSLAVSFDRQPASLLSGITPPLLSGMKEREYWIRSLYGLDEVVFLPFDREMMELGWEDFLRNILLEKLHACHLVCGFDYRFGHLGLGNAQRLRDFCAAHNLGCDVLPEFRLDGVPVHSTLIRELLLDGKTEEASRLLGHPYLLSGEVIPGKQLGRTWGTPTANLDLSGQTPVLAPGVYATEISFDGMTYPAVTNYGTCPTLGGNTSTLESWIPDFSGDLYGQEIQVFFHAYLRPEQTFSSPEELRNAILRDAKKAQNYFREKE